MMTLWYRLFSFFFILPVSHPDQASAQMKALNARFSTLHGISSLMNLFAIIALAFHGFQLGNVEC
jgi:hypothetical protein